MQQSTTDTAESSVGIQDNTSQHWQMDSLCMQCGKQGVTTGLVEQVPFFQQVICMSFDCPHCGNHNNEVTCATDIEPRGVRWTLQVSTEQDWSRRVCISEYATIRIPQIELEIEPRKDTVTETRGRITTVEGIWLQVVENLQQQQQLVLLSDEKAQAIQQYITQRLVPLRQEKDFVIELEDPSGISRIEWLVPEEAKEPGTIDYASEWDKRLQMTLFSRTREQNDWLGLQSSSSCPPEEKEEDSKATDTNKIAKDEIVSLPSNCPCCGSLGENRIHCTDIPHFKEILIMAFTCMRCGYKTNHIQSGLGIEDKGKRITLYCKTWDDYSRSVLLSDTCNIQIPELSLQVQGESFCKWTTVEGIVKDIAQHMERQYSSFFIGDSMDSEQRTRWQSFLQSLKRLADGEETCFTLILEDPAGNVYLENICAPEPDPQLVIETFERTKEMNEALGILSNDVVCNDQYY